MLLMINMSNPAEEIKTKTQKSMTNQHLQSERFEWGCVQDKVYQARKIIEESGEERLKKKLEETFRLLGNEDSNDSMSTVINVARYSEENFNKFKIIVQKFEEENEVGKIIPQKLFRLLQGCTVETGNLALQRAVGQGVIATANWLNIEINRKRLQESFASQTDCDNWEQARILYPEESERVDDFVEDTLNSRSKSIPRTFTEFCSQVRNHIDTPPKLFKAEVTVTYDGKKCNGKTAKNIISKYTAKMYAELKKIERNIAEEERDLADITVTEVPETQLTQTLSLSSEQ